MQQRAAVQQGEAVQQAEGGISAVSVRHLYSAPTLRTRPVTGYDWGFLIRRSMNGRYLITLSLRRRTGKIWMQTCPAMSAMSHRVTKQRATKHRKQNKERLNTR